MNSTLLSVVPVHFSFKGCLLVIFIFNSNFDKTVFKEKVKILSMHRLPMSHKMAAMLMWVNQIFALASAVAKPFEMFSLHVGFLILIHTDALGKVITIYHKCEGRIENSVPRVDV